MNSGHFKILNIIRPFSHINIIPTHLHLTVTQGNSFDYTYKLGNKRNTTNPTIDTISNYRKTKQQDERERHKFGKDI